MSYEEKMKEWQKKLDELEEFKDKGQIDYRQYKKEKKKIETQKPLSKKAKKVLIWTGVVFIALLMLLGAFSDDADQSNDTGIQNTESSVQNNASNIDKSKAEASCQEFIINNHLLNSAGLNQENVNLIDMWNYNNKLYDNASKAKDGSALYLLQWNGKNKANDNPMHFSCWFSYKDKTIDIRYISVDGVSLYGSINM